MIEKLKLKNFQRHERLEIKLDPKVTAITGPSDVGKSSVLRALRWLSMNRPMGVGYIREGCDDVQVSVKVDGETRVQRRRDKTKNSYRIKQQGVSWSYNAIGSDVPEDVGNVLNLGAENFQGQHDPPFWFGLSGSEVAKALNKIVDLSAIDEVASLLATKIRKNKTEVQIWTDQVDRAKEKVEGYEFVTQLVDRCKLLKRQLELVEKQEETVNQLKQALFVAKDSYREFVHKYDIAKDGEGVVKAGDVIKLMMDKKYELRLMVERARDFETLVTKEVPDIERLIKYREVYNKVTEEVQSLSSLLREVKIWYEAAGMGEKSLKDIEEELTKQLDGVCPVCGGPFIP